MLEKWIVRHWIALCVGCVLMGIAFKMAYLERGCVGFGSEWLVIPFVFVIERMIRNYKRKARRCMNRNCRR